MNGWISEIYFYGQCRITTFGDATNYYFNGPVGGFTLGMNVTFTIAANGAPWATNVVWDGSYSKPGSNGLFCGVQI